MKKQRAKERLVRSIDLGQLTPIVMENPQLQQGFVLSRRGFGMESGTQSVFGHFVSFQKKIFNYGVGVFNYEVGIMNYEVGVVIIKCLLR